MAKAYIKKTVKKTKSRKTPKSKVKTKWVKRCKNCGKFVKK